MIKKAKEIRKKYKTCVNESNLRCYGRRAFRTSDELFQRRINELIITKDAKEEVENVSNI